jgi:hypothetical protein
MSSLVEAVAQIVEVESDQVDDGLPIHGERLALTHLEGGAAVRGNLGFHQSSGPNG